MRFLTVRFVGVVAALLLLMEMTALGQSRARIITSPECFDSDDKVILELSEPLIAGVAMPFDKNFEADDKWLTQLVFRLTNKGTKPIAAIVITAGLLEGVDEVLPVSASYSYGLQFIRVHPLNAKRRGAKPRPIVGPGQAVEITAEGSQPYGLRYMDAILGGSTKASTWSEFAAKVGAKFQRMEIMRADVWFTDGSRADVSLVAKGKCDQE